MQNTLQKEREKYSQRKGQKPAQRNNSYLSGLVQALAPSYSQLILKPQQNFDLCPPLFTSFIIVWGNLLSTFENSIWIITSRSNYFISFFPLFIIFEGKKANNHYSESKKANNFSSNWSIIWTREITLSLFKCKSIWSFHSVFPACSLQLHKRWDVRTKEKEIGAKNQYGPYANSFKEPQGFCTPFPLFPI